MRKHTFGFPFYQCILALTKRRGDIVVADMVVGMVADKKSGDMELDMVDHKKRIIRGQHGIGHGGNIDINIYIDVNMEIQFGERVGHIWELVNWAKTFSIQTLPDLRVF